METDIRALTPGRGSSLGRERGAWLEKGKVCGAPPSASYRRLALPLLVAPRGTPGHEVSLTRPLVADNSPQSVTVSQPRSAGCPAPSACAVNIGFHRRSFGLYLTLFSKSFSPFPRGTCVISVSGRYLALEGSHLPTSRCTPKQRYSRTVCNPAQLCPLLHRQAPRDCHPLWCGVLGRLALVLDVWGAPSPSRARRQSLTPHLAPRVSGATIQGWACSCSLAATREISVDFFSSA